MAAAPTLVLLRHGESQWNASGRLTGWVDVELTKTGRAEAVRAGQLMAAAGIAPDVVYTSLLRRAITTADLALDSADRLWIPVERSWCLNERHYGALQGLSKAQVRTQFGAEQFTAWRRSVEAPPPLDLDSVYSQARDPRYANIGGGPRTESLADVMARLVPYYREVIEPEMRSGKTVLIAAHGNSLRALVKHLDGLSDTDITAVNIPTGIPLRYDLDASLRPTIPGGRYLDPQAAMTAAAAIAAQGGT